MSNIIPFFRTHTGAFIITLLLVMGGFVFGLIALMMSRSGASLRPIAFVGGFFLIVVGPQAVFHYTEALGWTHFGNLTWVAGETGNTGGWRANESLLKVKDGRFEQPTAVYGSAVDPNLVSDLRERLSPVFGTAQAAEMAVLRTGGTVVLAQFNSNDAALASARGYVTMMAGAFPEPDFDGTYTVQRATDVMKVVVAGRTLVAYSAPDSVAARRILAESPIVTTAAPGDDAAAAGNQPKKTSVLWLVALMVVMLAASVWWFFRVSSWAAEALPVPNVEPTSAATLRERLLSVNDLDVPFSVAASPNDSSTLIVTWRYADAKWMDLARVRGMKRTHRIIMKLDEAKKTVRPTEQFALLDWSAGASGGSVNWASAKGIVFYQYEKEVVFGLQLDSENRFTPKLSYSYTFNLQEMKAPLIQAVTHSGWTWRPTVVHGPTWLSWLTD